MNQSKITHLISKLNYPIRDKARKLRNYDGPEGRLLKIRKTLTELFKVERIELHWNRADETRGYADQLISQSLLYGHKDKRILELVDYYLLEKQLIYKFFYVLLPRFKDHTVFTNLTLVPRELPGWGKTRAVLELVGNPYPPLPKNKSDGKYLLHNVLLESARKQFQDEKKKSLGDV